MGAWLLFMAMMGGGGEAPPSGGCDWTAVSNDAWITVTSGASGSGAGTVGYDVAENLGAARVGTITVAGYTHTVYQAGVDDPGSGTGAVVTWQREPLRDTSNEAYATIMYPNGYQPCVDLFAVLGTPQRDTWAYGVARGGQRNVVIEAGCVRVYDPATGNELSAGVELDGVDVWLISETSSVRH